MFGLAGFSSLYRHSLWSQSRAVGQQPPLPVPSARADLGEDAVEILPVGAHRFPLQPPLFWSDLS